MIEPADVSFGLGVPLRTLIYAYEANASRPRSYREGVPPEYCPKVVSDGLKRAQRVLSGRVGFSVNLGESAILVSWMRFLAIRRIGFDYLASFPNCFSGKHLETRQKAVPPECRSLIINDSFS